MKKNKLISVKSLNGLFEVFKTLAALLIAMIIAFVVIFIVSNQPLSAIKYFLVAPLTSARYLGNVLENAVMLIFSGLAVTLMYSAGYMTLSVEGVIFFSSLSAAFTILKLPFSGYGATLIAILVAGVVGGLASLLPIIANRKWKTDPFVFSLLFNFVLLYAGNYVMNYYLRDSNYSMQASLLFPKDSLLPGIIPSTKLTISFVVVIVFVLAVNVFMNHTKHGQAASLIRNNSNFAKYAGINIGLIVILVQFVGGALAGIGSGLELFSRSTRFTWSALPGKGWDGFMIATLARNNPLYVPLAAVFLSYLRVGADIMNRNADVDNELVTVVMAVVILLIASKNLFGGLHRKMLLTRAKKEEGMA